MIAGVPSLCFHLFPGSGTMEGALCVCSVAFGSSARRCISTGSSAGRNQIILVRNLSRWTQTRAGTENRADGAGPLHDRPRHPSGQAAAAWRSAPGSCSDSRTPPIPTSANGPFPSRTPGALLRRVPAARPA